MTTKRNKKRKLYFNRTICYLTAMLLTTVLFYPSQDLEAKDLSALTAANPGSFSQLVKKASPSVVNINAIKIMKEPRQIPLPFEEGDPLREFFERYFRDQIPGEFRQKSLGTGFVIDKEGFIFTNNHVIEHTTEIKVRLGDGSEFEAKIVGRDPKTDLALIRIFPDRPLIPLPFGDSDKLEVGDWVVAIGNPFGLGNTVTAGIVSAKYRQIGAGVYDNFIQTDTSINPGNSGGPLVNTDGEVVGITTLIFSDSGGSIGIGFAIPINMAKDLLPQLRQGRVVRGWLGVMIQKITPELREKLDLTVTNGALVSDVIPGSPADNAGIKRGDVIVSFDGKPIKESGDLPFIVAATPVGKDVTVEVDRKGHKISQQVKTGELKEEFEPLSFGESGPLLGMVLQQITPELAKNFDLPLKSGILVIEVENNSPAAEAGFIPGDIILEIEQRPVRDLSGFSRKIQEFQNGAIVLFLVDRGGSTIFITLKM